MGLNLARLNEKRQAPTPADNIEVMRLKPGKNYIRIFKFRHVVTERDFELKLYKKGTPTSPKAGDVVEEIARTYYTHLMSGQAPSMCFINRANCEYCQESKQLAKENEVRASKQLRAQERNAINVINMEDPKGGMKKLDASSSTYRGIIDQYLLKAEDKIGEDEIFGCKGRDFIIEYNKGSDDPGKTYIVSIRDKERSEVLDSNLQNKVIDFYNCNSLDPQDAPPRGEAPKADQTAPSFTVEGGAKNEAPLPPKKGPVKVEPEKPIDKTPKIKVGDTVSFNLEGKVVASVVKEINGSVFKVQTKDGQMWQLDNTEIIPS